MQKFKKGDVPNLAWRHAVKKPIPVQCIQIPEPFEVETIEGVMKGQPGDWLVTGIHGEMYPIAKDIFEKTYDLVEKKEK